MLHTLKKTLGASLIGYFLALNPGFAATDSASSPSRYAGYEVDGRTSASVLSAKRSHAVSKQDEWGLGLFSGLIIVGLIVFFATSRKQD